MIVYVMCTNSTGNPFGKEMKNFQTQTERKNKKQSRKHSRSRTNDTECS